MCCVPQIGGLQRCSVCAVGASGARDGAGEEEATHAGDQTAKLRTGTGGRRKPQPPSGEGDGGFFFHPGRSGLGCED